MRRAFVPLLLVVIVVNGAIAHGEGETDYFSKIEALVKKGTPYGNPELENYLKSLTKDQMLTAAGQYCERARKTLSPTDDWGIAAGGVVYPLAFYGEESGGLSDESLNKLLATIADPKEGELFRYALVGMLYSPYARHLTDEQKDRSVKALTTVLCDSQAPERVRGKCCRSLRGVLEEAYRKIIYSDQGVREVNRTSPERWRNVFSLIDSGEIKLSTKTKEQLVEWRKRIHAFRKTLTAIAQNEKDPANLRKLAELCLESSAMLPLLNEQGSGRKRG